MRKPTPAGLKAVVRRALAKVHYASRHFSRRLRGRVVILTYHRVLDDRDLAGTAVEPGMYVRKSTFEAHMRFLRERFEVLSLPRLLASWREGGIRPDRPHCVVTFDDGWRDNYVHAFPILRSLAIPATIFLVTGFVGSNRRFWFDRLAYVLGRHGGGVPLSDERASREIERWKGLRQADVEAELDRLAPVSAVPGERTVLTWSEVEEMSRNGVSFGSHSITHAILSHESVEAARKEVRGSWRALRERQVNAVPVFSYPNGSYTDSVIDEVKDAGYVAGVSTEFGWEAGQPENLFALRRVGIHEAVCESVPLFAFHICGWNKTLGRDWSWARRAVGSGERRVW